MYFKCTLENGEEVYKSLDEKSIKGAINLEELGEIVYYETGDTIYDNDWEFTEIEGKYCNIVDVNLKDIIDIEELQAILEEDNPEPLKKVEFLEEFSYEHSMASLALDSPKNIYNKRIIFEPAPVERDFDDYDDPYSDDPAY